MPAQWQWLRLLPLPWTPLFSPPSVVVPDIHSAPTGAELLPLAVAEQAMAAACGPPLAPLGHGASPPEDDQRHHLLAVCLPRFQWSASVPRRRAHGPDTHWHQPSGQHAPFQPEPPRGRRLGVADLPVTPQLLLAFVARSGRGYYAIDSHSIIDHRLHPA
jgi:hypothetical protein